ncbi:MAG: hypothetical protein M0Z49_13550 [Chloroflexi bacterium]|nr:hypothetical protein [Chloroflexota bacterium]
MTSIDDEIRTPIERQLDGVLGPALEAGSARHSGRQAICRAADPFMWSAALVLDA